MHRLGKEGLTRHDAVHAIGSVVAEHLFDILKTNLAGGFFDRGELGACAFQRPSRRHFLIRALMGAQKPAQCWANLCRTGIKRGDEHCYLL
jgi:hypothetical protein